MGIFSRNWNIMCKSTSAVPPRLPGNPRPVYQNRSKLKLSEKKLSTKTL